MAGTDELVLRIEPAPDGDDEELAGLTQRLRAQLLGLDVDAVVPLAETTDPDGAKGLGTVIGWLSVHLGSAGLRAVLAAVGAWATRTGRTVEVIYGEKCTTLRATGVTSAQQEQIINDFLARHAPSP
jgi:hypothetical protein